MRLLSVRPQSSSAFFLDDTFHEDALDCTDHASADRLRLLLDLFLQTLQPVKLDLIRGVIGQVCGGCAGTRTINEAEGIIEIHFLDQSHRGSKIGFAFARENR